MCVCVGLCICVFVFLCVCERKRKRETEKNKQRRDTFGVPLPGTLCCHGDRQAKRDILTEAEPIVPELKKAHLIG